MTTSQEDFEGLWGYLWGSLGLDDCEAQKMARRLSGQGITTWREWVNSGCPNDAETVVK